MIHILRRIFFAPLFVLLLFLQVTSARALSVESIHFTQHAQTIQLSMKLSAQSDFRVFLLQNPYRLVVDLPRFEWHATDIERPKDFIISDIRQGPLEDDISRIVFDIQKPIKIQSAQQNTGRLEVSFTGADERIFKENNHKVFGSLKPAHALNSDLNNVISKLTEGQKEENFLKPASFTTKPVGKPAPPELTTPLNTNNSPLIVIDPGHGGADPGAISVNNFNEKDVVLALAKDLRDLLKKSGEYRVLLTRDTDKFIPLRDRVSFARQNGADLFISLHADSIHKSDVQGSSVYTLSKESSDAQTAKLAERENSADLIGGIDLKVEDEQVAFILGDFLMTETLNQSKFFANTLVSRMKAEKISVLDNTHRFAGFAVLKAPDIPSVLVEAGFMSNKKEASLLTQKEYRQKLSRALKSGIDVYFEHLAQKSGP